MISHREIFVPYSFGKQVIQVIIRVGYRAVSARGAVITVECRGLRAESLLARVPQIERLRKREIRVIQAGVRQKKRHRHDRRERVNLTGDDEGQRHHGDSQHSVYRYFVRSSLEAV